MIRKRYSLFCSILGFALLAYSCSTLAESFSAMGRTDTADSLNRTGTAIERARENITPEQAYYIGRTAGATLLTNYSVYWDNPALIQYINQICKAIAINSAMPEIYNGYHAAILDSPEINAFATSGGHIFITRGLLDCADSEDTLAAVIAHEIAHIQLQHSIQAIKNSRTAEAFAEIVTMPFSEQVSVFNEAVREIIDTLVINGYSQEQEFAADAYALELLVSTGYDPASLKTMLQVLEKNQPNYPGGFNITHPDPQERIKKIQKLLRGYKIQDTSSFRTTRYSLAK